MSYSGTDNLKKKTFLWEEETGWITWYSQQKHCRVKSAAAAAAKSLQLCLTLCDLMDSSPPGGYSNNQG